MQRSVGGHEDGGNFVDAEGIGRRNGLNYRTCRSVTNRFRPSRLAR